MESSNKDLVQLEHKNPFFSSLESKSSVCKNDSLNPQRKKTNPDGIGKPITASVPQSEAVLGKVKDFLGVIPEANARLQVNAKDNSENYDIEALTGNESQVIEMDLMLGVADLHTPEAVAAAESAIAVNQPVIPLAMSSSDTESEDSSDKDNDHDGNGCDEHDAADNDNGKTSSMKLERFRCVIRKGKSKREPKIVDMDVCQQVIDGYAGTLSLL